MVGGKRVRHRRVCRPLLLTWSGADWVLTLVGPAQAERHQQFVVVFGADPERPGLQAVLAEAEACVELAIGGMRAA